MKARIKRTGEIIDVKPYGHKSLSAKHNVYIDNSYREYIDSQLDFGTEIDWEQRRYEIARDCLAGYASNSSDRIMNANVLDQIETSIKIADALIEKLKKGGEE